MEVIIINDYGHVTGGSTSVAVASALGLAQAGHMVTYFCAVGPVAPGLLRQKNLTVVCLEQSEISKDPNRWRALTQGLRNREAVDCLTALLAEKDPRRTVVHVHTWTKALSPFALALAANRGFPVVVTLHDFFITCPTGGFFAHNTGRLCHRRPLSLGCIGCNCDRRNYGHKLWRVFRTVLQNRILHVPEKMAHFIGVSGFSLAIMKPYLPADVPVSVIRNPIECERRPAIGVAENREFIFVGRLEEEKGARLFAAAIRAAGVPGVFIGDGALRPELQAAYPEIRFSGWLQPAETRRALGRARALVFPPLWYETLGMVVVEAASIGIPVIISDSCAATDFVRNGETGIFFEHGSVSSLAGQIARLRDHSDETQRLGRSAYQWYWDAPWTTERHVEELVKVYQGVLRTRPEANQTAERISAPIEAV